MSSSIGNTLSAYWRLMRFHRPIGIWLLLWPTLWALWLAADGIPPPPVLIVFVLGTVLMRAAGCIINDVADRGFDPHVARTRDRPIAAGEVSAKEALVLFALVSLLALVLTMSLHNWQVLLLAVPALLIAAAYPFMKRWISLPQAVLGLAFSWGIPMAYAAVHRPWFSGEVLALMAANIAWVIAYDTYYAMTDREDDLKLGVKSSAIWFGSWDRAAVLMLQGIALLVLLAIGLERAIGLAYYAGLFGALLTVLYQARLTRDRAPGACFQAFLNNHYFGASVFIGLLVALL